MNMEGAEDAAAAPAPSSTSRPTSTETYKAPRIAPKFYDEGKKTKKISGRDKEKASRSRLMKDLRSQFENAPEELSAEGTGYTAKEFETEFDRDLAEKERFEEENFIRLNMSKQERKMREKMAKSGGMMRFRDEFADLDDFADIQGLDVEGGGRAKGRVKRKSDFLDDYVGRSGGEGGKGKKSRKR